MSKTEVSPIVVQKADTDKLFNYVFTIRTKVFVDEESVDQDDEYDGFDHLSNHYLALYEGIPVGTARWRSLPESGRIRFERFAVLKEHRKKGVGRALVEALLKEVSKDREIFVHAQLHSIDFFKKMGFVEEDEIFEEAGISHKKLIWQDDNSGKFQV